MESFQCRIAELNAAVECQGTTALHACGYRRCSREELARLDQNGVAQILSFFPPSYVCTLPGRYSPSLQYHTLSATSPSMRLYAEALVQRASTDADFEGVQVVENTLMYCILLRGRSPNWSRLQLSLWWAERCRLPVSLTAPNACSRLLALLSARCRQQVRHLTLLMRATPISDNAESADERGGEEKVRENGRWVMERTASMRSWCGLAGTSPARLSCSTFLKALPTFTRLTRLVIAGEYAADPAAAAAATADALRPVRGMSIAELELRQCEKLSSLSPLVGAASLEKLTVRGCGITGLEGLAACPHLSVVDVSENVQLTDVSSLAGAPRLRELTARSCAVTTLDGLCGCPLLKHVDLSGNTHLSALHGLVGAPRLQKLILSCTAVAVLDALRGCPSLIEVDVRGCSGVRSVACVAHLDVLSDLTPR